MQSFREILPTLAGMKTWDVTFEGKFNEQMDATNNPQQATTVVATIDGSMCTFRGYQGFEDEPYSEWVYWLPWRHGAVTRVPISELDRLGCRFFMTSLLTGCRFTESDGLLAHIAHTPAFDLAATSEGRDSAQRRHMHPTTSPRRQRVLSVSGAGVQFCPQASIISYGGPQSDLYYGQAMVFGYVQRGTWYFQYAARRSAADRWHWESFV